MASGDAPDRNRWQELYATGARPDKPPSPWIVDAVAALPNEGPVADVAGGTGRHAVPIARGGRLVVVVDFVAQAVATARSRASSIDGVVADASRLPLKQASFGVVIVANFLDRSIFPELVDLLQPGGHLVYETYTLAHHDLVQRGLARGPSTTEYLLRPGELPQLASPLDVIEYLEGEVNDSAGRRCCARLVARRVAAR
jgi:SAM-dependent methyltransferase